MSRCPRCTAACPIPSKPIPSHPILSCPIPSHPIPSHPYLPALVPEKLAGVFNDLLVRQLGVGLLPAEGEGFPQRHTECPHITGCRELALTKGSRAELGMGITLSCSISPMCLEFKTSFWMLQLLDLGPEQDLIPQTYSLPKVEPGELQVQLAETAGAQ